MADRTLTKYDEVLAPHIGRTYTALAEEQHTTKETTQ